MGAMGGVSPFYSRRVSLALIGEDFRGLRCAVLTWMGLILGSGVELTIDCHGYIIGDGSNEGQDASLQVEMGNTGLTII